MTRSVIVVTGTSSGLGAATARRLSEAGYAVVGFDRTRATPSDQPSLTPMAVDICSDDEVRSAFAQVTADSHVAGLVHCAGIAEFGPTRPGHLIDPDTGELVDNGDAIERTLHTNLWGTFTVVRHAASAIAKGPPDHDGSRGFIVLTSSGAALDGKAGQSAYSASKAGVIGMTLPLARELGAFGIRVLTIAPGLFDTPILAETPKLTRHVPFPPRVGAPEEFAALVGHIAENRYLNAEVIRIDGGSRGGFESTMPFVR